VKDKKSVFNEKNINELILKGDSEEILSFCENENLQNSEVFNIN
jgi:hypothetical protein